MNYMAGTTRSGKPLNVWEETTDEAMQEAFEALPPAKVWGGGFLLGEPYSTEQETGSTVYLCYSISGGRYYKSLVTLKGLSLALAWLRAKPEESK